MKLKKPADKRMLDAGFTVVEYVLSIPAGKALYEKIKSARKTFAQDFSCDELNLPVAITVANFLQFDAAERQLISTLSAMATAAKPFKVEVNGFASLPAHSIFAKLTQTVQLNEFTKKVKRECQLLMKLDKEHKPHFIEDHNIPIAKNLKPWQYEKAWIEYEHLGIHAVSVVNEIQLKRRTLSEKSFDTLASFSLGVGESVQQPNLFQI